jgi:hypothetical protein
MAFTMACPNFKKGLKMVSGPLGVKTTKPNANQTTGAEPKTFQLSY